jgi:phosphate:Na+ symporter
MSGIYHVLAVAGGLTLFLFGLNLMRSALIKLNNEKLKGILSKATGSKFRALITGILATVLVQSSSGVTAISVALICADLLTLSQGLMIMIGANIGTTATAFIFTLQIEKFSLVFVILGYILLLSRKERISTIGTMIVGFGILFLGIDIMNAGLSFISESRYFLNMMLLLSENALNSFLGGALISALLQSSSVTIGLSQNLYAIGAIGLKPAVGIMLGANVGTAVASLVVAVSSTKEAKAALYVNVLFNLVGGVIFLIVISPFSKLIALLEGFIPNKKLSIAYSHLIFNVLTAFLFFFIHDKVVLFVQKRLNSRNKLTEKKHYDMIIS